MCTLTKISKLTTKLPNYQIIEISGIDSQTFLQGQLTCDVIKMPENSSTLAAHCDPKGKVVSLFRLIKFSAEQFWFIFEKSLLPIALEQLKKYAVFSKVAFQEIPLSIFAVTPDQLPENLQNEAEIYQNQGNTVIHINAIEQDYYLILSEQQLTTQIIPDNWKALNMLNGTPLFTQLVQGEFIPQAFNLQHLEYAISFTKGCYIGQETIARAKYRGANKLAMFTLISNTKENAEIGASIEIKLENGWRHTGTIINSTQTTTQTWIQAILSKDTPINAQFRLFENGSIYQLIPNTFIEE